MRQYRPGRYATGPEYVLSWNNSKENATESAKRFREQYPNADIYIRKHSNGKYAVMRRR